MMETNIYIASGIKSNKPKEGYIGYVLQAGDTDATKTDFKKIEATSNQSLVICLKEALAPIKSSCSRIIIHTDSTYVNLMLAKSWKNQGEKLLKTAKGKDIQFAAEWKEIYEKLQGKDATVICNQPNKFKSWLQQEVERRG